MARPYICLLALAAMLLLGVATISRSRGLRDKAHQSAPRIPSQFSQEERVAMKEALKGEPGSPSPTYSQIQVPVSSGQPVTPLSRRRDQLLELSNNPQLSPSPHSQHLVPGLKIPLSS